MEHPSPPTADTERDPKGEKTLFLIYFGQIRERAGLSGETLRTRASTPRALYAELQNLYGFDLPFSHVRVAIGGVLKDRDILLAPDDTVVFLPPFGGG